MQGALRKRKIVYIFQMCTKRGFTDSPIIIPQACSNSYYYDFPTLPALHWPKQITCRIVCNTRDKREHHHATVSIIFIIIEFSYAKCIINSEMIVSISHTCVGHVHRSTYSMYVVRVLGIAVNWYVTIWMICTHLGTSKHPNRNNGGPHQLHS